MSLRCGTAFENPVTRAVACRYNAPVLEVVPGMTIKSSGEGVAQASGPVLSDYVVLLKPRVTALVVFTAGMIVAPDEEIGRASCRERVCQYVWVSVVAVPLTHKT